MKSSNLMRLSGFAALLGAVLLICGVLLRLAILPAGRSGIDYPTSEVAATWSWIAFNGIALLGLALLLMGLVGLYAAQSEAAGFLGLAGFVVLFVGLAITLGREWFEVFVLPDAAVAAPEWTNTDNAGWIRFGFTLPGLLSLVGGFLFAVATLKARVFPLAPAVTLMIGVMLTTLPLPYPLDGVDAIGRNAAVGWLGFTLFTGRIGSKEGSLPPLNLVRWGAMAAVFAGAAWIAWVPFRIFGSPSFYEDAGFAVLSLALIGTLGGLVGLNALQQARYGRLGQVGFYFAFVGTLFALMIRLYLRDDVLDAMLVLGFFGMIVGFVLLGIATLRARVLPRWSGLLLILSLPLWIIVGVVIALVADGDGWISMGLAFGLIWLALGYALLRQRLVGPPEEMPLQRSSGASEVPSTQ